MSKVRVALILGDDRHNVRRGSSVRHVRSPPASEREFPWCRGPIRARSLDAGLEKAYISSATFWKVLPPLSLKLKVTHVAADNRGGACLARVRGRLQDCSNSEEAVADFVLSSPDEARKPTDKDQ